MRNAAGHSRDVTDSPARDATLAVHLFADKMIDRAR